MKNYVTRTFVLTLAVIAILCGMHYMPDITFQDIPFQAWFGWAPSTYNGGSLRKVDLLSDLRKPEEAPEVTIDSALLKSLQEPTTYAMDTTTADSNQTSVAVAAQSWIDTTNVPDSIVPIIDYGNDSTHMGIKNFYQALQHSNEKPVRILWLGDSFVEGDILTGDLRAMLQKRYGGCGVGYLDMVNPTSGYRQTALHKHDKWLSHSYQEPKRFDRKLQGISKRYNFGRRGSWIEATCHKYNYGNDSCQVVSVIYKPKGKCELSLVLNKRDSIKINEEANGHLHMPHFKRGCIKKARLNVDYADSSLFYGIAMDGETGIVLDNISMRGNSGTQVASIPRQWLKDFNNERPYDLIIIQFGLNVASKDRMEYKAYIKEMKKVIWHLHDCMPQAGILVVGVGDRAYRGASGEMESMPGVKNLSLYQQNMAKECGVAFWSMHDAMTNEGGIASMVAHKPALANLDYTHINFRGGKVMARKLNAAIILGASRLKSTSTTEKISLVPAEMKQKAHETTQK